MTLCTPTRRRRLPGIRSANTTRIERAGSAAPNGTLSAALEGSGQVVLMVDFTSPERRNWWAVGTGNNPVDAIAYAQESCPTATAWRPLDWNDLYGD